MRGQNYSLDGVLHAAVVTLVSSIMPLLALFQVFDGMSGVTGGILRARGKQFVGAILNLRLVYFLRIGAGTDCLLLLQRILHLR